MTHENICKFSHVRSDERLDVPKKSWFQDIPYSPVLVDLGDDGIALGPHFHIKTRQSDDGFQPKPVTGF